MQTDFFFLPPIEVVRVTKDNLAEVAEWCGGKVLETESNRKPGRKVQYVFVTKAANGRTSCAFPGMYIGRRLVKNTQDENLRESWSVFNRFYFGKNYYETPDAAVKATWESKAKITGTVNHPEKQSKSEKAKEKNLAAARKVMREMSQCAESEDDPDQTTLDFALNTHTPVHRM